MCCKEIRTEKKKYSRCQPELFSRFNAVRVLLVFPHCYANIVGTEIYIGAAATKNPENAHTDTEGGYSGTVEVVSSVSAVLWTTKVVLVELETMED